MNVWGDDMGNAVPDYSQTINVGVWNFLEMVDDAYTNQLEAHQSRNGSRVYDPDVTRLKAYFDDWRAFIEYWSKRKVPDEPYLEPRTYLMPDLEPPDKTRFQNQFWLMHCMRLYDFRESLRRCQSRNDMRGFHADDVRRWEDAMQDLVNYFSDYVDKASPIDSPQSTSDSDLFIQDRSDYSPNESGPVYGGSSAK